MLRLLQRPSLPIVLPLQLPATHPHVQGLFSLEKRRLRGDLRAAASAIGGATGRMERGFSQGCAVIGQGGTALN